MTASVDIVGMLHKKSTRAFFLFDARQRSPSFANLSNSETILSLRGCCLFGKFDTVYSDCMRFNILKDFVKSAGCSTPDRALFCLFATMRFSLYTETSSTIDFIWDRSPSHQLTAVSDLGITPPISSE